MTRRLMTLVALALFVPLCSAEAKKNVKVEYELNTGYFEKNNSGLKGDASYLAFTDKAAFDAVFGVGRTMGPKPNFVEKDAFKKNLVVLAVIKRGNAVTEYKVDQVTAGDGTLYVQYTATEKPGAATARSPRR